jgi:tetratricopeptide (TPR) repeat protein
VSLLESGRTYPSVATLVSIADRLQTSLGQLLLDEGQLARETALNLISLARGAATARTEQSESLLDAASTLAGGGDDIAVELLLARGDIAVAQGRHRDADRWFREALSQAKKRRQRLDEPRAMMRLAALAYHNGDFGHARTQIEDSLAAFRATRTLRTPDGCDAMILHGSILVRQGKPSRALRVFEDAVRTAEREGLEPVLGRAYGGIGQAHAAAHHVNRAIDALQRARDALQGTGSGPDLAAALHQLGRLQLEAGHVENAQEALEQGARLLQDQSDPGPRADALTDLARAQLRAGRLAQAHTTARTALSIAGHTHDPGRRGRALLALAHVARAQRRTKQAIELLREATMVLRKARLPEELSEANRELEAMTKEKAPSGAERMLAAAGRAHGNGA